MFKAIKVTLVIIISIIFSFVVVVILSNTYRGDILNYLASKKQLNESDLYYFGGRPYGKICHNDRCKYALVDTGANISLINLSEYIDDVNKVKINSLNLETAFNTTKNDKYRIAGFNFLGRRTLATEVIDSKKVNIDIIGSPNIFTEPRMLLTRNGVFRDKNVDLKTAILISSSIEKSRNTNPVILAIYFNLEINGSTEKVLLDTGINNLLTSTKPDINTVPTTDSKYRLLKSANGWRFNKSTVNDAVIKLGAHVIHTTYESIPNFNQPLAKYLLGAEILNIYSIYFDFNEEKIYFIPISDVVHSKTKDIRL